MSQELLYTSAPQGLKPGSRGFCTVISTQGMAANLAERLESLSGYRHVFPPQDPQAGLNPINWSQVRLVVGGRQYHVLSRIAAAGLDYTQRSNKIAHHVVLDAAELISAGPAAALAADGVMETAWNGKTCILPTGRRLPTVAAELGICRTWMTLTGDAGWGGVLAEAGLAGNAKPAFIIYRAGIDLLPLFRESLALLPPEHRWQVTFSSYFTKLPPGVDCQWRGVVDGSPEAQAARRTPGALLIDLCRLLPRAAGGTLVEVARTGARPVTHQAPVPAGPPAAASDADFYELEQLLGDDVADAAGKNGKRQTAHATIHSKAVPPPAPIVESFPPQLMRPFKRKPRSRWPIALGLVLLALIAATIGYALHVTVSKKSPVEAQLSDSNNTDQEAQTDKKLGPLVGAEATDRAPDAKPPAEKNVATETKPPAEKERVAPPEDKPRPSGNGPEVPPATVPGGAQPQSPMSAAALVPSVRDSLADGGAAPGPVATLSDQEQYPVLAIPDCPLARSALDPVKIVPVTLHFNRPLQLHRLKPELLGVELLDSDLKYRFEPMASPNEWALNVQPRAQRGVTKGKPAKVATIRLGPNELMFTWSKDIEKSNQPQLDLLRNLVLRLGEDIESKEEFVIRLRQPERVDPISLRQVIESPSKTVEAKLPQPATPPKLKDNKVFDARVQLRRNGALPKSKLTRPERGVFHLQVDMDNPHFDQTFTIGFRYPPEIKSIVRWSGVEPKASTLSDVNGSPKIKEALASLTGPMPSAGALSNLIQSVTKETSVLSEKQKKLDDKPDADSKKDRQTIGDDLVKLTSLGKDLQRAQETIALLLSAEAELDYQLFYVIATHRVYLATSNGATPLKD